MAEIKITWKAFGDRPESNRFISSATIYLDGFWNVLSNELIMDCIYEATNLKDELAEFGANPQKIQLWEQIKGVLPHDRTHTSLSIGDEIQINRSLESVKHQDGPTYRVSEVGFQMVGA
jgi:hypothetical protein